MTAGDDELPGPDAAPHEVLGAPADADHAELRRCYARRIKRFRPDRAPQEFQRIHAAYQLVSQMLGHGAPASPPSRLPPSSASPSEPAATASASTVAAPAAPPPVLAEVASAPDEELASSLARALADPSVSLLDLLDALGPRHAALAVSPGLTWARLRPLADVSPALAAELVLLRAEHALEQRAPGQAIELLRDRQLLGDAASEPMLAAAGARIALAVVWHERLGELVLRPWTSLPHDVAPSELLDRLPIEQRAAAAWRDHAARIRLSVAADLIPIVVGTALRRGEAWGAMLAALRPQLDAGELLAGCDELVALGLGEAITLQQRAATLAGGRALEALPPELFDLLGQELVGFDRVVHAPPLLRELRVGKRYEQVARLGFARIIGELGINAAAVARWLRLNGKLAPTVAGFGLRVEHDLGLELYGAIAERAAVGWP